MYKLYYKAGTCSLAIHAILNELNQEVELIDYKSVPNYKEEINAMGSVPTLDDDGFIVSEGAAIALYLLEKHDNTMLPKSGHARAEAINWLMYANATVHPAYSKIFFCSSAIDDEAAKKQALGEAAKKVSECWTIVNDSLEDRKFLCGDKPSAADFMLTIYANWGPSFFPNLPIELGTNCKRMFKDISNLPSYQKALESEGVEYKAAA